MVATAGLLHDTVEDTAVTLPELIERFGTDVASIVEGCTEHRDDPQQSWRERKESHLTALRSTDNRRVLWVTAADKLSNVNSVLLHIDAEGPDRTWALFAGDCENSVWYYNAMSELLADQLDHSALPARLTAAVTRLSEFGGT